MPASVACATNPQLLAHGPVDLQNLNRGPGCASGQELQEQGHAGKGQANSNLDIIDLTGEGVTPLKQEVIIPYAATCMHGVSSMCLGNFRLLWHLVSWIFSLP